MKKKTHYVVIKGKIPGIYTTWKECKEQVNGYKGCKFKGFNNEKNALKYKESCQKTNKRIIYMAKNGTWDITPESHKDTIYISIEWLLSNLELSEHQQNLISDIDI